MATSARVSLRAPPHLPFVQGWPGIPGDGRGRKAPAVEGTVEVRVGNSPVKAKWVRVELRKYEALPPSVNQGQAMWTHVGQICDLWKVADGKEWEILQTADYKFHLPLPDNLPPSLELPKGGGVRYELVAAICYRQKGGLLKKESAPIMKTTETVRVLKHELHSAWPLYLVPDTRAAVKDGLNLSIHRPNTAFGPTDRLVLSASVRSDRLGVIRIQGFHAQIFEITKFNIPPAKRAKSTTQVRSRSIAEVRVPVNEMIGQGQDKVRRMALEIPADGLLVTTNNAKLVDVQYELTVKAVFENNEEVKVERLRYVVGVFPRSHAIQAVHDIGHFAALCPGVQAPPQPVQPGTPTGSVHSYQPHQQHPSPTPSQQPMWAPPTGNGMLRPTSVVTAHPRPPVEPFPEQQWRRPSSAGSTVTTQTTQTHRQSMDFSPAPLDRPYSTMGSPAPTHPSTFQPGLASRSQSYNSVPTRDDDGAKRYSTHTFGQSVSMQSPISGPNSDAGDDVSGTGAGDNESFISTTSSRPQQRFSVVNADPKPRIPRARQSVGGSPGPSSSAFPSPSPAPRPWESAESEKARLYAEARSRAAQTQQEGGASLARIGLDEAVPAVPPPEYAPQASFPVPLPASSSSSANAGPSLPASFMPNDHYSTAAEEKEQQRLRFEQAQRRTVSNGRPPALEVVGESDRELLQAQSSSSAPPPSAWSHSQLSPKPSSYETAAEEKERLRYRMAIESREQYAADGPGSGSMSGYQSSPSHSPGPSGAAFRPTNATDEKEQMRQSHEARDPVASGSAAPTLPASNSSRPQSAIGMSSGGARPTSTYMTADQEKDMMRRRYEEATQAVAKGHSRNSSTGDATGSQIGGSPSTPLATEFMSAEQEKEMMRRRFEKATLAVNSRHGMSPPSSPAPEASGRVDRGRDYMSAEEEKDIMRRRYAAATGARISGSPSKDRAESSTQPVPAKEDRAYPSAEQEKDLMRQRYEAATSAVEQNGGSSVPDNVAAWGRQQAYALPKQHPQESGSRAERLPQRFTELPPADAPPPPLPTRPPAEYINLLSPVEFSTNDLPPWAGAMANINQGMSPSQSGHAGKSLEPPLE